MQVPYHFRGICLALLLVLKPELACLAETAPLELEIVAVVASKRPLPLSEIAGQVSVIDSESIQRSLAHDLDDLLRHEPAVEAETSGTRFGTGGIILRGLGGNRVAIEIDGVPVRNGFAVGSYSNGGRDLIETERVQRVEILHGPASTLYGSDALGGVLAFTTWDPDDLLARNAPPFLAAGGGLASADESQHLSGTAALGQAAHGLAVFATLREGHQTDSAAVSDAEEDQQDWDSQSYAARYTWDTPGGNRARVSLEQFQRDTATDVTSLPGTGRFRNTTLLQGDDRDEREQLLLDYSFLARVGGRDLNGTLRAFGSRAETQQLTLEERASARPPLRYLREFHFDTDLRGLELDLFHEIPDAGSGLSQVLSGGFELLNTRVEELRDGWQQNMDTGDFSDTVLGETLPTRDFPISETDEWGLFLQDEINLASGWQWVPALRYDHYRLDPENDAIYREDFPDTPLVGLSASELTPRLALLRELGDGWSSYGQYVEGFRAPPMEDVNIGIDIALFRYRAIPNPELESEHSRGYELGLRQFSGSSQFSLTWFDTTFDDFIESRAPQGVDPETGYLIFQSVNIDSARIYGLDLRWGVELGGWQPTLSGFSLDLAAAWSRGENQENDEPLNSVSPPQALLGLRWQDQDGKLDAAFTGTFTTAQDRIDETAGARFATPGYGVLDVTGGWQVHPCFGLRAGIFNLLDQTYWRWADVARLEAGDPMIPLLARPGRNWSLTARLEF